MFRHGVTVNVLSNNVATLYGRSGVGFNFCSVALNSFFTSRNFSVHSRREFLKIGLEVEAAMLNLIIQDYTQYVKHNLLSGVVR